ncbi:uncharacterized protein [Epargyreus clarus]|uniref:uncharacterized protein n=1 Tax=Epargyreus clarus TaxID=520877 RepID=UPI003C2E4D06
MRNALVLVPLCIGLSSGFIVTTGTSEVYKFTKEMLTSKREAVFSLDEDKSKNETNHSDKTDDSLLYHNIEEKIKKELYSEGLEEDKNINERSFVFVNQRWKKIPTKTHLVDTKPGNSHLNRSFVLNVFEKTPIDQIKKSAIYSDEHRKQNKINRNNNNLSDKYNIQSNSDIHSKYHQENENAIKSSVKSNKNIYSSGRQNLVDNIINDYNKINDQTTDDRKYFKTVNKANNVVQQRNEFKSKQTDNSRSNYENTLFKVKMPGVLNDVNGNSFSENDLFQHTLEEQAPEKSQRRNDNNLNYLKYCLECSQKVNIRNLNNRLDLECRCKCGRFIHLRGSPQS